MVPISTQIMLSVPFRLGKYNLRVIDQGWVERFGAQGIFSTLSLFMKKYQRLQYSIITSHITLMLLFFVLIILFCFDSLILSVTLKLLRWCKPQSIYL